jgi:hypothetical protein
MPDPDAPIASCRPVRPIGTGGMLRKLTAWQLGLTGLYGVSQAFIAHRLGPVKHDALRLQTTTDAEKFRGILDSWDAEELAHYRSHLPPDMVHPLIYAASLTAGALNLGALLPLRPGTQRALVTAAWLSALGDYAENFAHLYLLDHRDAITPAAIRATGTITNTKWVLAGGVLATLLVGQARMGWRAVRSSRTT